MLVRPILCVLALILGALPAPTEAGMPAPDSGEIRVGRKTLREAQEAYEEGRLAESLQLYEAILATVPSSDERVEAALLGAAMIRLSSDPDLRDRTAAFGYLHELAERPRTNRRRDFGALLTLEDDLDALQSEIASLESALEAEKGSIDTKLAEQESVLEKQRAENEVQSRTIELLNREIVGLHKEISRWREIGEDRDVRIATQAMEIELLIEQLSGSQEDQTDMLAAVSRKNEELLKKEAELRRIRTQLQEREATLESKEVELQEQELAVEKREEAIRKAAESILKESAEEP